MTVFLQEALLSAALLAAPGVGGSTAPAVQPRASGVIKGEKRAPVGLLKSLRKQTIGEWCSPATWVSPAPLETTRFLELLDGGLLFFVQIPNYFCDSTNRAAPVVVTAKGEWRWGLPLDGLVTHLARSEDGVLWAATQWQIEGTFPALHRSKDGITWMEVPLPKDRATSGPMEEMTSLCFRYHTLVVKLQQVDDANPVAEVWRLDQIDKAAWVKDATGVDGGCQPHAAERWTREAAEEDRILFLKDGGKQVFSVPKLLRPH